MLSPFLRSLQQFGPLSEAEQQALQVIPSRLHEVAARQDIVPEGGQPADVSLIIEGFACRYKLLGDGRRQILAFLIPGDICDLQALLLRRMDHGVAALNRNRIATIPHERLLDIIKRHPGVGLAMWRETMREAATCRQWLANMGRSQAYARIAHLLCEVWFRLQAIGLTHGDAYELPMTQTDIGDAMGLSVVHVNRTLQQLRADGLISFRSNVVMVLDWRRLQAAAEFDPAYLQLNGVLPSPLMKPPFRRSAPSQVAAQ